MLPNAEVDQMTTKDHLDLSLDGFERRLSERIEKTAAAQRRWLVGTMVTVIVAYASVTIYLVQTLLSRIPLPN